MALLACGLLAQPAEAQVLYGSIMGTVEDQSAALVPKAAVTITSKATGLTRETTTDEAGRYSMLNVVPGSYDLKIAASAAVLQTDKSDVRAELPTTAMTNLRVGARITSHWKELWCSS
ncbi:MAG: carboxypeptidase-like regulatory domain-containing protein, partial [Acidobacteriota bacterium]